MTDALASEIMDRAVAGFGRPCSAEILPKHLRKPDQDGWWNIGTLKPVDDEAAYSVHYHLETGRGLLKKLPTPAGEVFREAAREGTLSRIEKRAAQRSD